ncbi:MAG: PadR family transcriptional regulator [Xenococcaceae cyanobacterium]
MFNVKVLDITIKEEALLRSLYDRDLYGLEISRLISDETGNTTNYKSESLYPTLRKLEQKGWITPRWGDELEGVRRKYYQITIAGKSVIENRQLFLNRLAIVNIDSEA